MALRVVCPRGNPWREIFAIGENTNDSGTPGPLHFNSSSDHISFSTWTRVLAFTMCTRQDRTLYQPVRQPEFSYVENLRPSSLSKRPTARNRTAFTMLLKLVQHLNILYHVAARPYSPPWTRRRDNGGPSFPWLFLKYVLDSTINAVVYLSSSFVGSQIP